MVFEFFNVFDLSNVVCVVLLISVILISFNNKMNIFLDIIVENIRIVAYMFSVVFSGYLVSNFGNDFLLAFRNPLVQFMMGTFLAMSMIDFRKYNFTVNLINLTTTSIFFVIMLNGLKYISNKQKKNEN